MDIRHLHAACSEDSEGCKQPALEFDHVCINRCAWEGKRGDGRAYLCNAIRATTRSQNPPNSTPPDGAYLIARAFAAVSRYGREHSKDVVPGKRPRVLARHCP